MIRCKIEGCLNPVWSKGLCTKHNPKKPFKPSNISSIYVSQSIPLFIAFWKNFNFSGSPGIGNISLNSLSKKREALSSNRKSLLFAYCFSW